MKSIPFLAKLEWQKLKPYNTFWILLFLYAFCLVFMNYIVGSFSPTINSVKLVSANFAFPDGWKYITWAISFLTFFLGLILITITCTEFQNKTHRQNILDGLTRQQFLYSKLLLLVVLAVIAAVMVLLTGLCIGFISGGQYTAADIFSQMHFVLLFAVQTIMYLLVALGVAFLIKKTGLAIGVFLMYNWFIENILSYFLNIIHPSIGGYLPLKASDKLLQSPFNGLVKMVTSSGVEGTEWYFALPVTCVWIGLIVFGLLKYVKKSDW